VRITYETGAGGEPCELPFVVGVVADLGGRGTLAGQAFTDIDRESFVDFFEERLAGMLCHPEHPRLVSTCGGLASLVQAVETGSMVRIRVLDLCREELTREPDALSELLMKESESRQPLAAVVADYEWGRTREEVELLSHLARTAAAIHAPLLTAPSPRLFGLDSFRELDRLPDPAPVFDRAEYAVWNALRDSEESRYLAMAMPRHSAGPLQGAAPCWSNSAYAYAAALARAFERYGWCGAACDLPPTWLPEVVISEARAGELARLGFLPLLHDAETGLASVARAPSAHRPRKWDTPAANSEEQLASNLPCLMAAARFVHYLKAIVRDWAGPPPGREEIETRLNRWLSGYLLLERESSPDALAQHPLREGRVEVREVGTGIEAVARLRPHHQLCDVAVPLRMVLELPRP
jgi:type VI secretion system protein ImpC